MREIRSSGSAEGVMRNHGPYSDFLRSSGIDHNLRFGLPSGELIQNTTTRLALVWW